MKNTVKRYAFVELIGRTRCLFTETWQPGASTVCKETWDSSFILSPTIMVEIREIWCKMTSCIFVHGSNSSNRSWDTGCVVSLSVHRVQASIIFCQINFGGNLIFRFRILASLFFCRFCLKMPILAPFGGFGCLVPKWKQYFPKRHTYGTWRF